MKIIKYGDKKKLKQIKMFECTFCGCLCEADNTEYKIGSQYNETYYYITCPFCGRMIYKGEED